VHLIFAAARLFPYWALSLAFVLVELGRFYRRRLSAAQWVFWAGAGLLGTLSVLWFVFGGYSRSDQWVRYIFGGNS
jgi:hypothetical protein